MELVMWALLDDNNKPIEQVLLPISEEEKAIDEFASRGVKGSYRIGYFKSDGTSHFNTFKQKF